MIGNLLQLVRNRYVQSGIMLLAVTLLARSVYHARDTVADGFQAAGPAFFALSVLCFGFGVLLAGLAWRQSLVGLGQVSPPVATLRVFFLSQLGKYLPGSVWVALMSIELGHRSGLRRKNVGLGVIITSALGAVTGLLIGLPALPFAIENSEPVPWAALLVGLPLLLLLVPKVLNRILDAVLRAARRTPLDRPLTLGYIAKLVGWIGVSYVVQGSHLVVLVAVVSDQPFNSLVIICGFALAWTVGFLFLPAPAGAGVREVVLIGVLSRYVDSDEALAIAVMSRAVTLTTDVVLSTLSIGSTIRRPFSGPTAELD